MFVNSAQTQSGTSWRRDFLTNGSRKYKLNKHVYETKQQNKPISDYYILMKACWEELESLNTFPPITTMTTEISAFVEALDRQREELKLFQFLNGLDEEYGAQRSQLLMMSPVPSVESACANLEQEESQRDLLGSIKEEMERLAMYSKSTGKVQMCTACNKTEHTREKCCTVVGYPPGHPRNNKFQQPYRPKWKPNAQKWNKNKPGNQKCVANAATSSQSEGSVSSSPVITQQQLEQLLSMLPTPSRVQSSEIDDEMDLSYAGMVFCYLANATVNDWIIDSCLRSYVT